MNKLTKFGVLLISLLVCGTVIFLSGIRFSEDEIYVLPKNYSGVVHILYDEENGEQAKYEKGKRVYEIPANGILKTKLKYNDRWKPLDRYYYRENGDLIKIPFVTDIESLDKNNIQVCCSSVGKSYFADNNKYVEFEQFYVGTKDEIKIAFEKNSKINPANLSE
jgi:hypothetical protein